MDPNPWSPFKKALSLPSCGSPHTSFTLPPSPPEDSLDKYYAVRTSNSMIHSSNQLLNGCNQLAEPPIRLSHPHYEPLLTPPMHPSKEIADFYSDALFNGVCKENQPTIPNFLQASGTHSQNENGRFPISEDSVDGHGGQEQQLPFRPSAIDGPFPGPFGVLPHEAVRTRPVITPEATRTCPSRYEKNNKFVRPVSKTVSASYNRGPYVKPSSKAVSAVYNSRPYAEPGSKAVSGTYNSTPCVEPGSKTVSSIFNNGPYAKRGSKTVSSMYNSSPYVEPVSKPVSAVYSSGPYSEPVSASYNSGPYSEPVSKTLSASYNSGQFAEPVSKTVSASYNSGSFAEPVSKTVTASYKSGGPFAEPVAKTASASHSSGSYAERDANSKSSSVPLSTQSNALSGDKAVRSPVVTSVSVTSPNISNYSSPSDYFPSPKPTVGAYNNAPSPVPQIEEPSASSVDQHSYPSSPFTNVEGNGLVSTATPCSPMVGSPYVNNLNQVSQRNGLKSQHSPSSVGSNSVMYTQQSQNIATPATVTSKTSDYHSDYAVYGVHDHNVSVVSPSPFSYAPMHSGQMTLGNDSVMSPQPHSQRLNSMPHDSRINFGHPTSIQQATMTSPTCIPNKLSHDTYGACSSSISPGQSDTYGACSSSISPGQRDTYGACSSSISPGQSDNYGACSSSISPGQSDTYGVCCSSISPGQSDTYGACSSSISPGQSDTYGACSSSISSVQSDIYGVCCSSISPGQSDTYGACSSSISPGQSTYGACSSSYSQGQSVLSSTYQPCSTPMNSMGNATMHSNVPTLMANRINNGGQFGFQQTDIDERNALDMFNTHVDSGVHNPDNSSAISNFLESELPILEPEIINNDMQLQLSEPSESQQTSAMNVCNSNRVIPSYPPMLDRTPNDLPPANMNFFNSDFNTSRPGSITFRSPRRRGRGGRRGRRRKANVNQGDISMFQPSINDINASNDVYSVPPSTILEYGNTDSQNSIPKRICDMKELPADYSLTRYRSELKMSDNQKKDTDEEPKELVRSKRVNVSIEDELKFLGLLSFPPANDDKKTESPTFIKTQSKAGDQYLQCFKDFVANWKSKSESDQDLPQPGRSKQEHKRRHKSRRSQASIQPKFVIRMGRCNKDNPGQWVLKETCITPVIISDSDDESASTESVDILKSSHNITPEADKNKKSKSGNSSKVSKHSAKKKHRDSVDHSDRYNDLRENPLNFTNYETLPAGELKIKKEIISDDEPSTSGFEQSIAPKKRGRKSKNATPVQPQSKKIKRRTPVKAKEPPITDFMGVTIKQEPIDEDDEVKFECSTRVLRSRKDETVLKDPQPGPSIKKEPLDYSSDEIDLDDSDSDPAWIPSIKQPKVMDNLKHQMKLNPGEQTVKKRRRKKIIRKNNSNGPGGGRVKKEKKNAVVPKKKAASEKTEKPAAAGRRKRASGNISTNVKAREKVSEYFVIAKSDLNKKIPYIWRLDKETNILQRYDGFTDHTGIVFHRNTNTYAAWNEMSSHNYQKINVKFITRSHMHCVVQYLGTVDDEISLENNAAFDDDPNAPKRNKVEIFLQILLSQALDPTFLLEIVRENDLYFLDCIREMERITGLKKQALVKVMWDQELRRSADNYPRLNILDCIPNEVQCQACHVENGSKLLQFYGQPYDHTSLGPVDVPLSINTHFNVCNSCSTAVSLYSHLHHLKFNYFIECNSKLNEARSAAKGNADLPQLLDNCLQDHQWVNLKFKELRKIWNDCERAS